MTTRRNVVTFALGAPLVAATGCGMRNSSRVRPFSDRVDGSMHTYAWQATDEVGQALEAHAAKRLPGVRIGHDRANFDPQKFTTLLASGKVPDIIVMDRNYVGTYAAKGLIRPLDEGIRLGRVDVRRRFYAATLADTTFEGEIYGIPQFYQPMAIMVNTRVMERSGVSLEDLDTSQPERLLEAVRRMYRSRGGKPRTLGLYPAVEVAVYDWLLAFGGRLIDDSGKPALDDPGNIRAVRFLKSLFDAQGGYSSVTSFFQSFDQFGDGNQFVRDQVGAEVYAQWYPNVLTPYADKVAIATVPIRDRRGDPQAVSVGKALVVPKTAKNPSAACRWALAITSDQAWLSAAAARMKTVRSAPQGIFTGLFTAARTGDDAVRRRYLKPSGNRQFDQVTRAYYGVLEHSKSVGASAAGLAIRRELNNAMVLAFTGRKAPADALHDAQQAALYGYDRT